MSWKKCAECGKNFFDNGYCQTKIYCSDYCARRSLYKKQKLSSSFIKLINNDKITKIRGG